MASTKHVPAEIKRVGRRLQPAFGTPTAHLRLTPSFLIVGAQRCGTTSMYRALRSHPQVLPAAFTKGVAYFDWNYDRSLDWYLGHFPTRMRARLRGPGTQTFESSGYYAYHPRAADRLASALPGVRLVLMVRDPIERAYSAHKHEYERGFETEEFERALELEDGRVEPEIARMLADPTYRSRVHRHQSYRRRGQYSEQLRRLYEAVGDDKVYVVQSEKFFADPARIYSDLLHFLGLRAYQPVRFDRYNARPRTPLPSHVRTHLHEHFAAYDEDLATLLGADLAWARS